MEYHNKHPLRLLTLEHTANDVERWITLFRHAGYPLRVESVTSLETLGQALAKQQWDAIISVEETPTLSALQILKALKNNNTDLPVIITVGEYQPDVVSKWLDAGARDAILATSEKHILHAVIRESLALEDRRQLAIKRQQLNDANERCQSLLASAPKAIAYIHYGMHVDANQAYTSLLGYESVDDLTGISLLDIVIRESRDAVKQQLKEFQQGSQQLPFECQLAHSSGQTIASTIQLSEAQYDNEPCIQVCIHPDNIPVLDQPVPEKNTLSSREQLFQQAEERFKSASFKTLVWVQMDDYDSIRKVTDINGVLSIQQSIAQLIREQFPASLSCHYGDDVFLILDTTMNVEGISEKLEQLQSHIHNHLFGSEQQTLTVSTTIGFATHEDSNDLNGLIACAQTACELCQQDSESDIKQYSRAEVVRTQALDGNIQARIEQAISEESFRVSFQPVINVTGTEDIPHYEMLVHIPVTSGSIIDIRSWMEAEELSNLMPLVDRWTLRQGMLELTKRQKSGTIPRLIVHISQWSLQDPKFIPYVINLLKATRLPADRIVLQLQESVALQQLKGLVEFDKNMGQVGCLLSIEHFQGDPRALRLLQHLNLYLVQLDEKFTRVLGKKNTQQLEEALNSLGDNNTHCVATGVVNSQTIAHLWRMGIDFAKGDYISQPSPAMDYDFA